MLQGAATTRTPSGPAFTRYVNARREPISVPTPVKLEEKTEQVFGIDLPLSVARSEREMVALKEKMVKIARIFSQNYSVEVLPSPNGTWSIEVDPDASRYGREYVTGGRNTLQDIPEDKFKAKKIFYDARALIGASEEEILIKLRHQVGRIQQCDIRNYFEGQRLAKAEGALPSSWLSLHNALDECWVDTRETLTSDESRAKIAKLHQTSLYDAQRRVLDEPLTRQFTENLRYYWIHGKIMPEIKSKAVIEAFQKLKSDIDKYFYSKTHAEAFSVLKNTIWPAFKLLEKEARHEEGLREAARKVSGITLGATKDGVSGKDDLLALWDNDEVLKLNAQNEKRRREILFVNTKEQSKERARLNVLRDGSNPTKSGPAEDSGKAEVEDKEEKKPGRFKRAWHRIKRFFGAKPKQEEEAIGSAEKEVSAPVQNEQPAAESQKKNDLTEPAKTAVETQPNQAGQTSKVESVPVRATATPADPASEAKVISPQVSPVVSPPVTQEQPALDSSEAAKNLAQANSTLKAASQPVQATIPNQPTSMPNSIEGVDVTNHVSPPSGPDPKDLLAEELSKQIEDAARKIEIDKLKRSPVVADIDLKILSAESSKAIREYLQTVSPEIQSEIEQQAAQKLELKQARALLFEMPAHMQVDARTVADDGGATFGFTSQPSWGAVRTVQENIQRFITDFEAQEETRRVEKIRIEQAQLAEALRQERERRDMRQKGFSESEAELYKKFINFEFEMRGRIQTFMTQLAPQLPKEQSFTFDGAHYTGSRLNKKAIAHYAPIGDMRVYSRRKAVEGEDPKLLVELLIDNSGSMEQPPTKLENAIKTAVFFGRVLRNFGIPFSIKLFARGVEPIKGIEQDYDRPDLRIKYNLITKLNAKGGGTDMHSPLQQAHAEISLIKRRDPSMIAAVFVISDSGANEGIQGQPLKDFIDGMRHDCTVTNFILTKEPKEVAEAKSYFGPQNVVAPDSFEELPDEAIRVLRRTMERAFRAQGGFKR